jgi:hypothetical protein
MARKKKNDPTHGGFVEASMTVTDEGVVEILKGSISAVAEAMNLARTRNIEVNFDIQFDQGNGVFFPIMKISKILVA